MLNRFLLDPMRKDNQIMPPTTGRINATDVMFLNTADLSCIAFYTSLLVDSVGM